MWLRQKELTEAVEALQKLAQKVTDHRGLLIQHPARSFDTRKWEAEICGMFASHSPFPDAVLPEKTYIIYPQEKDNEAQNTVNQAR